jgi:hypothetical protein
MRAARSNWRRCEHVSAPHLFPQPTGNVGGRRALNYCGNRGMLNAWLALCNIHDEHGEGST